MLRLPLIAVRIEDDFPPMPLDRKLCNDGSADLYRPRRRRDISQRVNARRRPSVRTCPVTQAIGVWAISVCHGELSKATAQSWVVSRRQHCHHFSLNFCTDRYISNVRHLWFQPLLRSTSTVRFKVSFLKRSKRLRELELKKTWRAVFKLIWFQWNPIAHRSLRLNSWFGRRIHASVRAWHASIRPIAS